MEEPKRFILLLSIVIGIFINVPTMPVFSESNSQYESILTELRQSINLKDKNKASNAISKLKNSKSEIPLFLLLSEIDDTKQDTSYRGLLADFVRYKIRYTGKDDLINNIPSFKKIIKNSNQQAVIRRNIISALTKMYLRNDLKDSAIEIIPFYTDIVKDKNEDPKVVAQAIDSLSRLKYDGNNDELLNIVANWKVEDPFKVRSASESLGRLKEKRAIPQLINIINSTDNMDLFVTAVYSLGLMESPEMIEPLLNNYDSFGVMGRSACRGALRKNKELLIKIIAKEKTGPMTPSVIALGKIKEKSALPYLNSLLNDNVLDKSIILTAIKQIEAN
jgi:hypothetical protein